MATVSTRITVEPGKRGGKTCIRGLRITVWDVLSWEWAKANESAIITTDADFVALAQRLR